MIKLSSWKMKGGGVWILGIDGRWEGQNKACRFPRRQEQKVTIQRVSSEV